MPYGIRPAGEVRLFSEEITRFLVSRGAGVIVVACNTASAAALHYLRHTFPETPFVGMEPAVKPAVESTHSRVVGVLATPATFQGELYASVVERFAGDVTLFQDTCPGLVQLIENGELDTVHTRSILEQALHPMLARGIDTIVLGCTHYPFVIPLIQEIAGPQVRVIDPAPAVARQAGRLLALVGGQAEGRLDGKVDFFTSGRAEAFEHNLKQLLGETGAVHTVNWDMNRIVWEKY